MTKATRRSTSDTHGILLTVLRLLVLWSVLIPISSAARVSVQTSGPRSTSAGMTFRRALEEVAVQRGVLVIQVRRKSPAWSVIIKYSAQEGTPPLVSQVFSAPHGRVSSDAAQAFAKRVAAALRRKRSHRPPPPKKSIPVVDPDQTARQGSTTAERSAEMSPQAQDSASGDLGFEVSEEKATPAPAAARPAIQVYDPAEAPQQPRKEHMDELGFQVTEDETGSSRTPRRRREGDAEGTVAAEGAFNPDRLVLRVEVGLGMGIRRFLIDAGAWAVDYETGAFSQFSAQGELYPLQLVTGGPVGKLGLFFAYETSAGLSTEQEATGLSTSLETSILRFALGLVYRLPRFSNPHAPCFSLHVGVSHYGFAIETNPSIYDFSLTSLVAGAQMTVAITSYLVLLGGGEYHALVRGQSTLFDPYLVKTAGIQGYAFEGGVLGHIYRGLGYKASLFYERLAGQLPAVEIEDYLDVRDHYLSVIAALTYEL